MFQNQIKVQKRINNFKESLRTSEARFHNIIGKSADGIIIVNKKGIVCFINPSAERLFGHDAKGIVGKLFGFPLVGGESTEIEIIGSGKKVRFAEMRVVETEWEGEDAYLASIRDITERIQLETELIQSEEKFKKLSISAQDAIILIDSQGYISFWNNAAEDIFGYTIQEAIGKDMHALIVPQRHYQDFRKGFSTFKTTGEGSIIGKTLEFTAIRKAGTEFPVEISVSSVQIGNIWHSVGIVRDITERKELYSKLEYEIEKRILTERKLAEKECQAAVGLAIAQIAHGTKNILNALQGGKYMVNNALKKNDMDLLKEGWDVTQSGILRMETLTHDLLDISRFNKLDIKPASLNALAHEVIHTYINLENESDIKVLGEIDTSIPEIMFDHKAIHTAVMNLVSNAVEACRDNEYNNGGMGKVILRTYSNGENNFAHIEVEDNGCGIEPEEMKKIFDMFYSTKHSRGSGLGLSITKKFVEQHGGKLELNSEAGKGTLCRLSLLIHQENESDNVRI